MKTARHIAFFGQDISSREPFIKHLLEGRNSHQLSYLPQGKGALFSPITLQAFIEEEFRHEQYILSPDRQRSILSYSSGEQRKALLDHLLGKDPDFLVLEDVFDFLDHATCARLRVLLEEISHKTPILQIVKRKSDLLPFITWAISLESGTITWQGTVEEYLQINTSEEINIDRPLPPAPESEHSQLPDVLIDCRNINVSYGDRPILKNINWQIRQGEFWQLKGPNGSGKTTLLNMITGDNPKAYGQNLYIFGKRRGSGESIWDIKRHIGYMNPTLTVRFRGWNTAEKMIISGLEDSIGLYKKPTEYQRFLADEWLKLLNMEEFRHIRFNQLSPTRQCLVLIARAMIKHPALLILDEPGHSLDDGGARILSALINKIAEEGKSTIIFVSHRQEPDLKPRQVYELFPTEDGSLGKSLML